MEAGFEGLLVNRFIDKLPILSHVIYTTKNRQYGEEDKPKFLTNFFSTKLSTFHVMNITKQIVMIRNLI